MVNQRFLSHLAFCASFFALGVIALGAFTRLIDAGLGCPDWPGCYGNITVPLTHTAQQLASLQYPGTPLIAYKAWAEMVHRYFVGGLSLFIMTIIVIALSKKTLRTCGNLLLSGFLLVLLAYQIMLGQWTVTLKLLPVIVSQHLLGGYFILATLWLIYLTNKNNTPQMADAQIKKLIPWTLIALLLVLLQIMLGAWTSTNYASLSCPDFPFCTNEQAMTFHFKEAFNLFAPVGINYEGGVLSTVIRQTIQMTHRFGAMIVTCYFFMFLAFASLRLKQRPDLMKTMYLILGLLSVQLCVGISNVIFKLPLATAISHTLFAVLLLLSVLTFLVKLIVASHGVKIA